MSLQRCVVFIALITAFLVLFSCSTAPTGPQKGTPAFYWQAARESYATGDYTRTVEHLDRILASENEFSARALPWSLVLTSGMAAGYMELADDYTIGGRVNKSDPSIFRRQASEYRGAANRLALQIAESFGKVDQLKGDTIPLAFALPKGSAGQVAQLTNVVRGVALAPAEAESAQRRTIERHILLSACHAAGAPNDSAKTDQILKNGDAQIARPIFMMAMAENLYDESQLYTRDKLDEPQKLQILCERAKVALKSVPESKETKELTSKIEAALKKGKKT